jgi:nucleotide-binding universal stress UspA family protein
MYEKILVPLDGSKVAETALPNVEDLVIRMAPNTRIEITLLQVISNLTYNVLTPEEQAQIPYSAVDLKQIKQNAADYLEKVAAPLRDKRIDVKTMVTVGNAAEEIIKAAQKTGANVIAMSTHGYSGIKRWALGSVADKVLHSSEIPVLTIRAK